MRNDLYAKGLMIGHVELLTSASQMGTGQATQRPGVNFFRSLGASSL